MVFTPKLSEIKRHIDHYWILNGQDLLTLNSNHMYAYPGITPDMIIVLEGYYTMTYMGKTISSNRSQLFSFIHREVRIDFSRLKRCVIVKFKSRGLSSLQPFIGKDVDMIMRDSVAFAEDVFGPDLNILVNRLLKGDYVAQINELDHWFLSHYQKEHEGFVIEMSQEVSTNCDLHTIMEATGYSYSTLERYFKKETGLTPKRFQTLQRFKRAMRELSITKNNDWLHYVAQYGYYDQSHFIKEIKRFTKYTPSELLQVPTFIQVRPEYS